MEQSRATRKVRIHRKPKMARLPKYLLWLRSQPCANCGDWASSEKDVVPAHQPVRDPSQARGRQLLTPPPRRLEAPRPEVPPIPLELTHAHAQVTIRDALVTPSIASMKRRRVLLESITAGRRRRPRRA